MARFGLAALLAVAALGRCRSPPAAPTRAPTWARRRSGTSGATAITGGTLRFLGDQGGNGAFLSLVDNTRINGDTAGCSFDGTSTNRFVALRRRRAD